MSQKLTANNAVLNTDNILDSVYQSRANSAAQIKDDHICIPHKATGACLWARSAPWIIGNV